MTRSDYTDITRAQNSHLEMYYRMFGVLGHAKILAETGQRVQLTRQPSGVEKLLWAAALAPDDAEAQAPFAKARELAAKDPAQRPDAAISTAESFRAFFSASPQDRLR